MVLYFLSRISQTTPDSQSIQSNITPKLLRKSTRKAACKQTSLCGNTGNLLNDTQLGGRKQRSAVDTALLLLHYIQQHKKGSSSITTTILLDIKGAFDHVLGKNKNKSYMNCRTQTTLSLGYLHFLPIAKSNWRLRAKFNSLLIWKLEYPKDHQYSQYCS